MGKSKEELELENKILRELLLNQKAGQKNAPRTQPKKAKQILYQCKYCGYKSVRSATDGAPLTVAHCTKHPKGWCKGLHSWTKTYL